jgi:hypothetical protein
MHHTPLLGCVFLGAFGAVSPTFAASCEGGATVTITAKVLSIFPNKSGQTTVNVGPMSPCEATLVVLKTARPPASCRFGTMLTATGKVDASFLGTMFIGDTFRCE